MILVFDNCTVTTVGIYKFHFHSAYKPTRFFFNFMYSFILISVQPVFVVSSTISVLFSYTYFLLAVDFPAKFFSLTVSLP